MPELSWGRAAILALGWTLGSVFAVVVLAGLLNGLSLVDGRDEVVALWVAIITVPAAFVASVAIHQSNRVAILLAPFLALAAIVGSCVWFVASYGQWAK